MSIKLDCRLKRPGFGLAVQLALPAGTVLGLRGENGSGKSTTLDMISGLVACTEGSIRIDDVTVDDASTGTFVQPEDRNVATVFQAGGLFPHLSVEANILFGRGRIFEKSEHFDEIIDAFGLRDLLRRKPQQLSGGQRQRVALARAFLSPSRVLLLDEPTTFLDARSRGLIRSLMKSRIASYDGVVVLVSHDDGEISELATAVTDVELTRGDTTMARIECQL